LDIKGKSRAVLTGRFAWGQMRSEMLLEFLSRALKVL
jgi:hypothetical protein